MAEVVAGARVSRPRDGVSVTEHVGTVRPDRFAYALLAIFVVLEYARPALITLLKLQMLIVLLMPVLWYRSPDRPWSKILLAQILYLLWTIKSIPIAHNWFAVYFNSRILFGFVAISLGLSWVCSYRSAFRSMIWLWLAVMTYQALWGITHGGRGSGGLVGDENDLALACATAVPFAYFGFEQLRGRRRLLCLGILALLVAAIVTTFSRSGFLALLGAGGYCWLTSRHKLRSLAVIIIAGSLLYAIAPPSYIEEVKSIQQTNDGTAKGRRFLWAAAWNMFEAHTILGVGAGNPMFLVGRYQPTDFEGREYNERDWSGTTIHSAYFQGLAEHGVPGMAIWLSIAWLHFKTLRRLRRRDVLPPEVRKDVDLYAPALAGGMVGFLVGGAFLSVGHYPYYYYFSALAVALDAAVEREAGKSPVQAIQT